eukprot:TRINITY_DN566_c8_g1_i1.p2 TRINITY_DN566_c8_g1~~TRINITY_DN566_c8_g1_i1.p2  ORF type:complete len:513 (-),score=77.97 TRINITY_DN566_c8_g1_i1:203-1579(-)
MGTHPRLRRFLIFCKLLPNRNIQPVVVAWKPPFKSEAQFNGEDYRLECRMPWGDGPENPVGPLHGKFTEEQICYWFYLRGYRKGQQFQVQMDIGGRGGQDRGGKLAVSWFQNAVNYRPNIRCNKCESLFVNIAALHYHERGYHQTVYPQLERFLQEKQSGGLESTPKRTFQDLQQLSQVQETQQQKKSKPDSQASPGIENMRLQTSSQSPQTQSQKLSKAKGVAVRRAPKPKEIKKEPVIKSEEVDPMEVIEMNIKKIDVPHNVCWFCLEGEHLNSIQDSGALLETQKYVKGKGKNQVLRKLKFHFCCAMYSAGGDPRVRNKDGTCVEPIRFKEEELAKRWQDSNKTICTQCGGKYATVGCIVGRDCLERNHYTCLKRAQLFLGGDRNFALNSYVNSCTDDRHEGLLAANYEVDPEKFHGMWFEAQLDEDAGTPEQFEEALEKGKHLFERIPPGGKWV